MQLASNFADMTGAWTLHQVSDVPIGYQTIPSSGGNGNDVPYEGMPIYFAQYQTYANEARVELVQQRGVAPTDPSACTTDSQAHIQVGETKIVFRVTRN